MTKTFHKYLIDLFFKIAELKIYQGEKQNKNTEISAVQVEEYTSYSRNQRISYLIQFGLWEEGKKRESWITEIFGPTWLPFS